MIKLVIFDMDGTILNSDILVLSIYELLIAKYPPNIEFKSIDKNIWLQKSYLEGLKLLYDEVSEEHLAFIKKVHQEKYHFLIKLFPQVNEVFNSLKKMGIKIGLFTSELSSIAVEELTLVKVIEVFDYFIAFEDVDKPKPSGEGLLKILKEGSYHPDEVMYIGDQKGDANAAKEAGITSVLIARSPEKVQQIGSHFDYIIYEIEEILHLIKIKNNFPFSLNHQDHLSILQFTDLHLMNNKDDELTYQLIKGLIQEVSPDYIVLTGDQTMSKEAVSLYQKLGIFMDQFKTPYSFVFGNHDTDFKIKYTDLIGAIKPSKYLKFEQGPVYLGYGNYYIPIYKRKKVIQLLIFLDTHIDARYEVNNKNIWGYGAISPVQVEWYENVLKKYPNIPNLIFMHIPPYIISTFNPEDFKGYLEEKPSVPPLDYGFIDTAIKYGLTKGIFYGHDHYNDAEIRYKNILFSYGRVSGHYDYGRSGFPKGARMIKFYPDGQIKSECLLIIGPKYQS